MRYESAADWPATADEECWVPTDDDAQWWAEQNDDDAWDAHPTIDDQSIDDEAAYQEDEARRYAADPTDEEIAETWTDGDEWGFDDFAGESAYMDAHEQGRKTF
jgi:hypothetical protein